MTPRRTRGGRGPDEMRVVRNPDVVIFWGEEGLLARDLRSGKESRIEPALAGALARLEGPRSLEEAAGVLSVGSRESGARAVRELRRRGLLLDERDRARRPSLLEVWKANVASAHHYAASRDMPYLQGPQALRRFLRTVAAKRRPARFKRYRGRVRVPLRRPPTAQISPAPLGDVLARRRTTRFFTREPVSFEDLSALVGGTC
ncbi:MAG TPA: hypothetical protein VIE39_00970 [Thermoanaerobaculia bacterium]